MKEQLRSVIGGARNNAERAALTREYLQARILQALQEGGAFRRWAFVDGTALRFLYSIPRYSEDLDFSLASPDLDADFDRLMQKVASTFHAEGYEVSLKVAGKRNVASAFVRFPGLLHALGLSARREQILSIKVEVDTNPPAGAGFETTLIRRHVTLNLLHHDRASLLAGKLHALLSRNYTKGRDLYDLLWYLSDPRWPDPNLPFLNTALAQTGWNERPLTERNWRRRVRRHLDALDWTVARRDVQPFLERPAEIDLLTAENLGGLLARRG